MDPGTSRTVARPSRTCLRTWMTTPTVISLGQRFSESGEGYVIPWQTPTLPHLMRRLRARALATRWFESLASAAVMSRRSAWVGARPVSMAWIRWREMPDALDNRASVAPRLWRMARMVLAKTRSGPLRSTLLIELVTACFPISCARPPATIKVDSCLSCPSGRHCRGCRRDAGGSRAHREGSQPR